ncbi:CCA tRNA nucleotidyltransferase [Alphaproteobacteria bacterium]|nr:CCA tRNA nucleotidyltransferase [Alphaproteobacteria bacterium]
MNKIKLPKNKDLQILFDIAFKNNAEIRIVGGAIRNILLKKTVNDFDLSINISPDKAMNIFKDSGLKVIPTGIDFGTITVKVNNSLFEITSLRKDISTDGRRAVVEYTYNWQDDSIRRDFTINAIYADANGKLYDYHNGLNDLKNKKIVFVGNAEKRIKEDALRILRLFRFTVTTGFEVDEETYLICKNHSLLIKNLSFERISQEMIKILKSENFNTNIIYKMRDIGILQSIIPMPIKSELSLFNTVLTSSDDYIAKIIALSDGNYDTAITICNVWKLSNKEKKLIQNIFKVYKDRTFLPQMLDKFLYYYDYNIVLSASLLKNENFYEFVVQKTDFIKQKFPIDGDDLIALGIPKGAKLGSLLKAVESWWVANNFKPKKQDCLLYVRQIEKI